MAAGTPTSIGAVGAMLGEGSIWVAREAALWFVDILFPFDAGAAGLRTPDAYIA